MGTILIDKLLHAAVKQGASDIHITSHPHATTTRTIVRLRVDGSALVCSGTSDMGQGARTIFAHRFEVDTAVHDVLDLIDGPVYLTVDLDVFDLAPVHITWTGPWSMQGRLPGASGNMQQPELITLSA